MTHTTSTPNKINQLVGFDPSGDVFLYENQVIRGIRAGYEILHREVLKTCTEQYLFDLGIVATCISDTKPNSELNYKLFLKHEKIPYITYPHEWPAPMLKDAAFFHTELFLRLGEHNLTIKDWHPYNILFKGTEPVFVDFTSIIPLDKLPHEEYLKPEKKPFWFLHHLWNEHAIYFYEMYRRMYLPYFLLPLYLMHIGKSEYARKRLLETTLNASLTSIATDEVFTKINKTKLLYHFKTLNKQLALLEKTKSKQHFMRVVENELQQLCVNNKQSGYSDYYQAKNEALPFEPTENWTNKQRVIYQAIQQYQPKSVLDVASNTGWFSKLAAKHDCKTVALDIDEPSINNLYEEAKSENLDILPLVIDITDMTKDIYPNNNSTTPLLLATETRLQCDMVLVLALIHHLILGQNQSLKTIINTLAKLAKKLLILEFVAINDNMIVQHPDFFPALHANPKQFSWYNRENIISELEKYFANIEIKDSFPETRKLLICHKHSNK